MIAHNDQSKQIDAYIDRVLSGEQVASRAVIGACRRHRDDMAKLTSDWPYEFNPRRRTPAFSSSQWS